MDNNIAPTTTIHRGELKICLVEMSKGTFSVGIVEHADDGGEEAFFPFDFDHLDSETAARIGADVANGRKGDRSKIHAMGGYTMPYPIKIRDEEKEQM